MFLSCYLTAGANPNLRDPQKGFTALEWAQVTSRSRKNALNSSNARNRQFTGRKNVEDVIRNHLKCTSSKNSARLSQALNETENWFKQRLNNVPAGGNSRLDSSCILNAAGAAALCGVLPAVQPDKENCNVAADRPALVVPSIVVNECH